MIAGFLRGAADFIDAVQEAFAERRAGFSEREAGDFLDASGITDGGVSDEFMDVEDLDLPRSSEPQSPLPPVELPECREYLPGTDLPIAPAHPIFCELPAGHPGEHVSYKHPDRAIVRWPRAEVSHEDLAAHITASRRASEDDGWGGTASDTQIASDLLADFHISRKK
ncbi:hypothetical protein DORI_55 [Mycobacterium phage Dori]|uniref:hypothetical protein n=1 Tax=Mycobacterium phage Dori TaxID=1089121 RepID=UPI000232F50E|nr:hypothetical protein DORI_55 [Mycobacterium phage Dori]AER47704.1 hypothetical protein DORI_55 [Mycobacterium phage Dori]